MHLKSGVDGSAETPPGPPAGPARGAQSEPDLKRGRRRRTTEPKPPWFGDIRGRPRPQKRRPRWEGRKTAAVKTFISSPMSVSKADVIDHLLSVDRSGFETPRSVLGVGKVSFSSLSFPLRTACHQNSRNGARRNAAPCRASRGRECNVARHTRSHRNTLPLGVDNSLRSQTHLSLSFK